MFFEKPIVVITFDCDWAPDWCIELSMQLCRRYDCKSTFFVTHPTEVLNTRALRQSPELEIGIHPNFLPNSTHGQNIFEIMSYCLNIAAEAKAMRTHNLYQSSALFSEIAHDFPQITIDSSLFLPFHKNLNSIEMYYLDGSKCIYRLPFFWEDDAVASNPNWLWTNAIEESPGLHIYNFHPIHVALNTTDLSEYNNLKRYLGTRKLTEVSEMELKKFIKPNNVYGTRTFLEKLLRKYSSNDTYTLSEANVALLQI